MYTRISLFIFSLLLISFSSFAQPYTISGKVADAADTSALIGVTVIVKSAADSTLPANGGVTDADGKFNVGNVNKGTYLVKFDYVGYKAVVRTVNITGGNIDLGTIKMVNANKELKGVTIKDKQIRAVQMGDTSQFNADAYKTHPDATAEDLVTKMPGVTSDANGVKVNGESLQEVYVDGKPFFGSDPTLALKSMPAEIVDKIQVFDKLSDQSAFTGFDDGNSQKTMNIVTRGSKREGVFGKVYAGYGTDETYSVGGNVNIFKGDRRITLVGMSNNINLQNFSTQDLLGVSSGSGGNRGGGGGGRGSFGGGGGGNTGANFFVGQSNGITTTNSLGFNYSDNWGKKLKVSGSYFFNGTDNINNSAITRNYYTNSDYLEHDTTETRNTNHRVNLRFEYTIDSFNTVIFTPGISFQDNHTSTTQSAFSDTADMPLSRTRNYNAADNSGYSSSDNILLQHKFKKQRRTISLNVSTTLNEKTGTGAYNSNNAYFLHGDSTQTSLDQHNTITNSGYNVSPNVTYTEPVGKKGQLMVTYNPSWSKNNSDKETYDKNATSGAYVNFDTLLSNKYNTIYNTQRGGLSYRVGDRKMTFSVGANLQYAMLHGEQTFPYTATTDRNFVSVLPTAMYNYRYTDGRNLRIMYRTNTQAPSVTQLQNVVDISNPLLLKTGNPDLQQDYEHTFIVRYGATKAKSQRNFFMNLYANYINNYIGNSTIQPVSDIRFKGPQMKDSIIIKKGSQLTLPVNLNGYFNERAFVTYSLPVKVIKSNLNFNGGLNFTRTPGEINFKVNYANNFAPSAGVVLSSNISTDLDFTLSYFGNYNVVNNTLQTQANNNYFSHVASFKINYIFLKNFVFNTNITNNYYAAFSGSGDQNYFLWNAYVGYKMLKGKALEARITAFDILNQNKSVTRTVSDTYVENNITTVLQQYFMLQLTYTIRNFKGQMPTLEEGPERGMRGPGGPGGFGGHGGPGGFGGPGGPGGFGPGQ